MKSFKIILVSLSFIALIVFNVSIHSSNSNDDVSIIEVEMSNAAADPEASDWDGKSDVGCVTCSQPGTVQYYCKLGSSTCFQTDCVGGIC